MTAASTETNSLITQLIDEASDVDLVCYLAHSGGPDLLKDLFECIRDARSLSVDDLLYNIDILQQKKVEASLHPMGRVVRRLMQPRTDLALSAARYQQGDHLPAVRH